MWIIRLAFRRPYPFVILAMLLPAWARSGAEGCGLQAGKRQLSDSAGSPAFQCRALEKAHFQRITLGRDFGDTLEVISGLEPDAEVITNPGDKVQEGAKVKPVMFKAPVVKGPGR